MSQEIETAAAASLAGPARRGAHAPAPGTPCANCATPLLGPWCWKCGQAGEDFHRSLWRLVAEVFEGLFHLDGRVWTTLPALMWRPARLTRAYLDGHRAPQIPPLRLFLVVLLVVFLAPSLGGRRGIVNTTTTDSHGKILSSRTRTFDQLNPAERAELKQELAKTKVVIFNRPNMAASDWLKTRMEHVLDDPERFKLVLEQWSERFAFLTLPMAAGLFSLLFVFQRRFYVFDHVIFSLHSLAAVGLMLAVAVLLSKLTGELSILLFMLAAPVHLFAHMRGVYGTSIAGTLARMVLLFMASVMGAAIIFIGLMWVGLSGMAT